MRSSDLFALGALSALALLLAVMDCSAQTPYRILQGRVDSDGAPTTPARICLGETGDAHCYTPPDYQPHAPFGLDAKAVELGKLDARPMLLFTATYSAGGSGDLTSYALLTQKDSDFVNLLPALQLTNQSEFAVWNLPEFSAQPILLAADFVWNPYHMKGSQNEQETHYGPHKYTVRAFLFDPSIGRYRESFHYDTERSYSGLNNVGAIRVLDPERKHILVRLRKNAGGK